MSTSTFSPDRAAFRETVAEVAAKATAKLPASAGRIASAVTLVLAGDVELLPGGGARVASRTAATVTYHAVNGHCDCKDFPRAPMQLCSHRLAYGIARRAAELVPPAPVPVLLPAAPVAPVGPLPEAPASVNVRLGIGGRDCQLTLRDTDETRLLARLQAVLAQYPVPAPQTPPQGQGKDWCAKHHATMKLTTKDGRSWYSHKTADGQWCKGK